MRAIALVAGAVFKESVRDRVPYSMVAFAALLMAASLLISQLTAGQDLKIIKDLGLSALSMFGLIIAIFIGIGLVAKEVERRSIYALLAKPVTRDQFIVGKYTGLAMTLVVNLTAMTAAFYAVLLAIDVTATAGVRAAWEAPAPDPQMLKAVVLIVAELLLVTALAVFFSTFAGGLTAAALTLGLWVAGHFSTDLRNFESVTDAPAVAYVARALYYLLPNLAPFNVRAEVVHGVAVSWSHLAWTLLYALVYIAALLCGAVAIFRRRDFK